ncbi:MAG: TonB-dependent receptor [Terricaulis sp.]
MKKYLSSAALLLVFAAAPSIASAQDATNTAANQDEEIIVTGTRADGGIVRDQLGGSVTVLSSQDMRDRQVQIVSDVLRDVPGAAVNRTGPVGGVTQVRLRGAEGNHTLVMIDGMDVSDPYFQEFDFTTLINDDVSRVEVLRGQQSALYGSDAIGGVVQYFTATGAEAPGVRGHVEYGSFNTAEGSLRVAGANGGFDYALSGDIYSTDGVPSAPDGDRALRFDSTTAAARLGYRVNDALSVSGVFRAVRSQGQYNTDTDAQGLQIDSPNTFYENDANYGLVRADLVLGNISQALTVQGVDSQRFDNTPSFGGNSSSNGNRVKASYVASMNFGSADFRQTLTGAVDYRRDEFHTNAISEHVIETTGAVLEYDGVLNQHFAFGAAARFDHNQRSDDDATYRVQASYAFDSGTRIRGAAASGIKNPTMTELFGFGFGFLANPDLKPEKSQGWELGVEQQVFGGAGLVGVTYFDNTLHDEITSVGFAPASAINLTTDSKEKGVELFLEAQLSPNWSVDFAYTYLDAKQNGVEEVRRAPNIASLNVDWRSLDSRFGANLNIRYNGEQRDNQFLFVPPFVQPVTLDEFTLVNIGADWKLTDKIDLYGRVENALDEDYQEVFGYATAGRAAYVGLRAGF